MPVINWLDMIVGQLTNHPPLIAGLIGLAVGWAICPGYMYLLALCAEWRWLRRSEQFRAFLPGNWFLGGVFGSSIYLYATYQRAGVNTLFTSRAWSWVAAIVATTVVVVMWVLDILGTIQTRGRGSEVTYGWKQLVSWTKLWHNTGVYGYLLIYVGVPGIYHASWASPLNDAVRVIFVLCLIRWVFYLHEDATHPRHRTGHVAPRNVGQWLFGLAFVIATIGPVCVIA